MNDSNPRKRTAQSMMFQRALMGLQKNSEKALDPPQKRARVMDEALPSNSDSFNHSNVNTNRSSQSRHNRQFNPPPKEPQHNFLYDRQRDHSRSHYSNKPVRHTPATRFFGKAQSQHSHRQQQHHSNNMYNNGNYTHYNSNNNSSHHSNNYRKSSKKSGGHKYKQMEENRMRKLWTDFAGSSDSIFSELRFCRDTSYFVTSNSIAHKMSTAIKLILSEYFEQESGVNIVDGLSCIGGNTYSFAKVFDAHNDEIYANELDVARYQALKHNMNVFAEHGLVASRERFHFYNVDFLQLHEALGAEKCGAMDVVFLDPEWNNGDDYKQTNREMIHLFNIGALHLYQVVNRLLNEWYVNLKIIAIKVAKNYDQQFLMRKFQKCKLIESKRFRIAQLSFHNQTLVLIVRATAEQQAQENKEEDAEDDHKLEGNVEKEEEEEEDVDVEVDNQQKQKLKVLSFEEILHSLPEKMTNKDCVALNNRDIVTVQLLS